ncbi:MAG: adenosylhomocysteinase [Deltaproteobacteria bacterium]|nr:adenosylhomocysteinase [Deltaproteobacteria bacterium]
MDFRVKHKSLASLGISRIKWAAQEMKVLNAIKDEFEKTRPFRDLIVGACLHVTAETAVLALTLQSGGAEIYLCASNPLSTQDDVASALVYEYGVPVFAVRGDNKDDYYRNIQAVISKKPACIIDDGCDLTMEILKNFQETGYRPCFGCEETTTGVLRLRALESAGKLIFPVLAVNDSRTKNLFDNRYGTGQSVVDALLRSTNYLLAGKVCVVCGYGWCGRGIAKNLRGMGCRVRISEVDPITALEAVMDGFDVGTLHDFIGDADIVVTATGNINVVRKEHLVKAKNGVILANAGHFDVEIEVNCIENLTLVEGRRELYRGIIGDTQVFLLAQGRLCNLGCAEGHPSSVMDLSFSTQALGVRFLLERWIDLKPSVISVPTEIERKIAELKLKSMSIKLDELTTLQKEYLSSYEFGT